MRIKLFTWRNALMPHGHRITAKQCQPVAWGQVCELQRVNRSPRSTCNAPIVPARFDGKAVKSSRDEMIIGNTFLGLHQHSLWLG